MEYSYSFGNDINYDSSKVPKKTESKEPSASLFEVFKYFDHSKDKK